MNSFEFYNEVRQSRLCPENFDYIYTEFGKYQKMVLGILNAFHNVCENNNVRYQLAFGSLLGAVRDEGQIPWDYDIDVFVPFEERYLLVDALKKNLPTDYYFYCPETNEDCRHYFMRISPKGFRSDKLHIDVFYLIGTPNNLEQRFNFENKMMKYFHLRYIKLVKIKDYQNIRAKLSLLKQKVKAFNIGLSNINDHLLNICTTYDPWETGLSTPVFEVYKHLSWDTQLLWDTVLIDTKLGTFRISRNYDSILRSIYDDYLKIYPLKNRLAEMIQSYEELTDDHSIFYERNNGRYYMNR